MTLRGSLQGVIINYDKVLESTYIWYVYVLNCLHVIHE